MKNQILFLIIFSLFLNSCNNDSKIKSNKDVESNILPNDEVLSDIDGNTYKTIKINGRIWMESNLKTTKFSNGDPIPNLKKDSEWKNTNGPAYCLFDNSIDNFDFGSLYNLKTIIDKRGICPKGWNLPTNEETNWNKNFDKKILNDKLFNSKILGWRSISDDFENDEFSGFFKETELKDGSTIYWLGKSYLDDNYDTENPNDKLIRGYVLGDTGGEYYWGNKYDGLPCRCVKDTIKN